MLLYKSGEVILKKVLQHKGSLKNLVFASKYQNPRQLYALLCETLKYYDVLNEILEQTSFIRYCKGLDKHLVILLMYDFLFGKGIRCSGKLKNCVVSKKSLLQSALARIKIKRKVFKNEDLIVNNQLTVIPKYLRINTLKKTLEEVQLDLEKNGFNILSKCSDALSEIGIKEYTLDSFIPNLITVNPRLDFHDNSLYLEGHLIFQDRSSCIPSQVLSPPIGSHVIDACAAPGNKTSHIAALMQNTGKIYAFDLNMKRLKTMESMLDKAGVKNCVSKHCDFLSIPLTDPNYVQVTHILVDPSCSGSGIVNRLDHLTNNVASTATERLQSLSRFQLTALNHALSFPNVSEVVYSTCSIHEVENECVVQQALEKHPEFSLQACLPEWKRRGNSVEGLNALQAQKCIRCDPKLDNCNGFFVAKFVRNFSGVPKTNTNNVSKKSFKKRKVV